jgi:hypothetical protein
MNPLVLLRVLMFLHTQKGGDMGETEMTNMIKLTPILLPINSTTRMMMRIMMVYYSWRPLLKWNWMLRMILTNISLHPAKEVQKTDPAYTNHLQNLDSYGPTLTLKALAMINSKVEWNGKRSSFDELKD